MQTLAAGVGDLKKVLTNVKTRGTWGEVQLEALLEQMLTAGPVREERRDGAEAAASASSSRSRLPGRDGAAAATPVWLPIDAKFPREDYERLIDAQERADPVAVEEASRALEAPHSRRGEDDRARSTSAPPHTTDFALLFLPTEGLYAEVLRRPA